MLRAVYSLGRHSIDIFIVDAYNKSQHAMIKEAREFNDVYNYMQYLNKHPEGGCASEFCSLLSRDNSYNYTYGKDTYKYISQSRNSDLTMRLSELAYSPVKKDNKIEGWKLFIEHVPENIREIQMIKFLS